MLPTAPGHGITRPSSREGLAPSPTCRPGKVVSATGMWPRRSIRNGQRSGVLEIAPVLLGKPMEDFMSKPPFSGGDHGLDRSAVQALSGQSAAGPAGDAWLDAAEDCVLARIETLRIFGGLPRHLPALSHAERRARLVDLLGLWASGCFCAIDERLFADVIRRRRPARSSAPLAACRAHPRPPS